MEIFDMSDTDGRTMDIMDDKDIALSSLTAAKVNISLLSKVIGKSTIGYHNKNLTYA
jgi:hypothetical protein